ncbi:MAG: TolC family outer membrane protein [Candidatus Competibacteraceae bacterium]|uniref:Outer membrane protein tolC n=1 Tax=Candidatus Contendobacter odensis Run_B_J11 TaxID=1400861 RepID=A0A7U7GDS7_9GAMM|nr:TolC family outer membrane protein [Candidatus Contendobacter odensis]MBK8534995.1 TolC family outer membrane protein [Candidatus Competibacteraceae bacterium]MBK8753364.1 TolC family outer membrane protein [Candidatus Competibacteraceae bacterium]CDH46548.1 putative Outer membrane protein tolC [Candidatus Contendobacter odensis Run_B_J11]
MPKVHRLVLVGMVAALCGQPAGAEDLLQVYRQAFEGDPVLKAAAASREAAQETKPQARALLLPNAGVTVEQGRTFGISGAQDNSSFNSHNYAIGLTQPIYNRNSQVRQRLADTVVSQSDVNFRNTQDRLILRVAQGYFGVLAALDILTFTTAAKNAFARQLEQANRRFEVGLATITDVYDAQARFDAAVSQEVSAINALADARELLRQLTNQEYAQIAILSEQMPLSLPKPSDPDEWVRMALENNLELRSANFDVDKARENINLQKSGHYPTLDFKASRADFDNSVTATTSSQVNLELIIPLYTGGAVSSRSREAAYNYEAARQSLEDLQRNTIRTVRNAYRGQETAISQIKARNQTRISTRSALEANQAGYEVGTRTIVDVLDAERNVYQAEADYANARYSYIVSFLTLRQAAGQLSEADVIEINGWLAKPRATDGSSKPAAKEPAKPAANKDKAGGKPAKVADRTMTAPAPQAADKKATPSHSPAPKPSAAEPK